MSVLPASATGPARFRVSDAVVLPLIPRNIGLLLLTGYRATISKLYGDVCRYYPSCSAYAVTAVQQHGLVRGSGRAISRIARCHPWAAGGEDDVPPHADFSYDLTSRGFVVPRRKD
ncbi:membrane protein insertion efficiency factor YidD [Microbacterium amylolyticum]|uniref:Putative membrane protein insertion efficiency factor n=1 Tax=Microbacterium amylolyticum TaxID=936337 RepID=A0ABS4ZHS4_9MICO|nr:membrane protein insertion efficiency factor YidD [Microbacterium amylolyticum]MBP2436827.1 putative membrane protein insertion efficiency factor [Microbacterium amylolyticum]